MHTQKALKSGRDDINETLALKKYPNYFLGLTGHLREERNQVQSVNYVVNKADEIKS